MCTVRIHTRSRDMLMLTRRLDETIIINENIVVKILAINGRQVKIGIEAPKDVSVHRSEIQERILRLKGVENELANSK